MLGHSKNIFIFVFILTVMSAGGLAARNRLALTGSEIPGQLSIGSRFIFFKSDSLYLNGQLLEREVDYRFISGYGYFDLSRLNPADGDSLTVIYKALPGWLEKSYGRPLELKPPTDDRSGFQPQLSARPGQRRTGTELDISGAKSFRFSARTAGSSEFSQSLDLKIAGELSPGLEITGSISDRGYDPAYGTANSRLNEIDRVNIRLQSRRLTAQVGDVNINPLSSGGYNRSVSGASFALDYPAWFVRGAVARPKGLFETYGFYGQDGFQGPYRVGSGSGAVAIVPGSETVWLDGIQLERGANKDYTMDYVTGRVTFNVTRFIDSRSRIEVDYEPLATAYKEELFAFGGGARAPDSVFFISFDILREGDDRSQPLLGELSDSDIELLDNAGDNPAYRDGATTDTAGNYILVADSLPDSVFSYVGDGHGDFNVAFSYVGPLVGDYKFLGNDRYEYVGDSLGDYRPIVIIAPPVRTDYMQAVVGSHHKIFGELRADIRRSTYDRNLYSDLDDGDNEAWFYNLRASKDWRRFGRNNNLLFRRRQVESDYKSLERLNRADFTRDFLIPPGYLPAEDELLYELKSEISPLSFLDLSGFFSTLDYKDSFKARTGGFGTRWYPFEKLTLSGGWWGIAADYGEAVTDGDGSGNNWHAESRYRVTERLEIRTGYEKDSRENKYFTGPQGTRFDRLYGELAGARANLRYEYYREDSLTDGWNEILKRNRVTSSFNNRFGNLGYDLSLAYQWLNRPNAAEENFLGRVNLRYHDTDRKFRAASSFTISEELRNARGITYLEVEPGRGNYIFEDGQYVNDPDGNFIRVEEILSDNARVRRSRKTFDISKDWPALLVRFNSDIEEELLEDGERSFLWILPFYSDDTQPYLYFSRRYNADIRIFPVGGFHTVNIILYEKLEIRDIVGEARRSRDDEGELSLKQKIRNSYFDESLSLFKYDRDEYYSGAGVIDGYRVGFKYTQSISAGEVNAGSGYRRAQSDRDERSQIYTVSAGSRFRIIEKGEIRTEIELYRQRFTNLVGTPSYKLTGNRPGEKGAEWKLGFNYRVRGGLRLNFSVSGRHADNRTARVTGRGEVVAGF